MHGEQADKHGFGYLDRRLIGPPQKRLEPRFPGNRETQHEEMEGEKNREREPGESMHQGRHPEWACARREHAHASTIPATARKPSAASDRPNTMTAKSRKRAPTGAHSMRTVRTPIEACTATAATNTL